ncbi:PST-A protein [Plasmodium gonderi]|uniref:PST-A protein n=1 Tax=Plasmodium gonderi TaxID=77519 RepID=A0A1Y1JL10_PLAGO|nr:PST-A protein [Plasmodium gonderi]GAW83219.1 PST-A protein [Plasmodium gonderi]
MARSNYYDETILSTTTKLEGQPKHGCFFNKDSLLLRTYGWLVQNAIGIIILIHGLNSHARLTFLRHNVEIVNNDKAILKDENNYYIYENSWIEHFNNNGYSVYALDLQGHGLSDGWENLSLNINDFDDLVYDVIQYIKQINDEMNLEDEEDHSIATFDGSDYDESKVDDEIGCKNGECNHDACSNDACSNDACSNDVCSNDECSNDKCSNDERSNDKCSNDERNNDKYNESNSGNNTECIYGNKCNNDIKCNNNNEHDSSEYTNNEHNINGECKNKKRDPLPIYLLGQSMGGNIVLRTLEILGKSQKDGKEKLNIKGCISLSSMICFQKIASPRSYKYKYFYLPFTRLISGFFPTSRLVTKMGFKKYPYLNDLANYDKIRCKNGITLRYWHELLKATSNLEHDMELIPKDIPILLIHSKDDIFCYYKGVLSFFNRLINDNKELLTLEDMEHGLTIEPGNEKVLEKVMDWITNLSAKEEKEETHRI